MVGSTGKKMKKFLPGKPDNLTWVDNLSSVLGYHNGSKELTLKSYPLTSTSSMSACLRTHTHTHRDRFFNTTALPYTSLEVQTKKATYHGFCWLTSALKNIGKYINLTVFAFSDRYCFPQNCYFSILTPKVPSVAGASLFNSSVKG